MLWTGLVFASGFITLYGWEVIGKLASADPSQAAILRLVVDTVTIGLDHSDRFLGCLWVLLTSWTALRTGQRSRPLNFLGLAIGMAGVTSSAAPALNELGYAFGVGVIVWWIWLGIVLLQGSWNASSQPLILASEGEGLACKLRGGSQHSERGLTALPFLRDNAKIQSGQSVLIYGASGSVGAAAAQLARYYGAKATGVCSTANLEWVRSLGASQVIDYTQEDFTQNGSTYDIIFDTVGKCSLSKCKSSLTAEGSFLSTVPNHRTPRLVTLHAA